VSIIFGVGESEVRRGPGMYLGGYTRLGKTGTQGELLLTNKRLVFLVSEKTGPLGLGGKRTNVIFNVPLANVTMARMEETGLVRKSKELVLTFEDWGMLQNPRFKIEDPEGWVTAIQAMLGRA
jgi:hypothetical protein